jgi:DNA-binding MarR family transcriptional regulator
MSKAGEMTVSPLAPADLTRDMAIAGALALLDKKGIDRLTPRKLAAWLGVDPAAVRHHFRRRGDLLEGVAAALTRDVQTGARADQGWEDHLRQRAKAAYAMMSSRRHGALLVSRTTAAARARERDHSCIAALINAGFGESAARAALLLVDRFTLGWAIAEQTAGPSAGSPEPPFADQLELLMRGLASGGVIQPAGPPPEQYRIFQNRLWVLLRIVRESADIAYSRTMHLAELDRRILLLLKAHGGLNVAEISASTGADKAQVSRAVKRVEVLALVERATVRSALRLSAKGGQLTERMMRQAELRNSELTFGITEAQLVDFFAVLESLTARAALLYEQEHALAAGRQEGGAAPASSYGTIVVERERILPPLTTLCSYAMRSGALTFKRLTGLSNFEAWVLSEIASDPPLGWTRLTEILDRDHSQAGRTITRLIELDLITRSGGPGRRNGAFSPTSEGKRLHGLINYAAVERSEFLLEGIAAPHLSNFLACFATIMRNAEAQLERERAVEEMQRDGAGLDETRA